MCNCWELLFPLVIVGSPFLFIPIFRAWKIDKGLQEIDAEKEFKYRIIQIGNEYSYDYFNNGSWREARYYTKKDLYDVVTYILATIKLDKEANKEPIIVKPKKSKNK